QLLYTVAQLPEAHPQELGGSGLVVTGLFQGLADGFLLHVPELLAQGQGIRRLGERLVSTCLRRWTLQMDVRRMDGVALGERHGPFQYVLELAHVAREGVALEQRRGI